MLKGKHVKACFPFFCSFDLMNYRIGLVFVAGLCLFTCSDPASTEKHSSARNPWFEMVPPSHSNISFANDLSHTERLNTYTYRNFYNGAGVAVGDINNDGLLDIYIAGNQVNNKLYLNKGDLVFEDVTVKAGVACEGVWSTGVSMADVNGDGLLDIYVCKSGPPEGPNRNNELFINNGDLTFSEQASAYGIDDKGLSNHAVFLDYDLDGDLDMYLLNNSLRSVGIYDLREGQRSVRDPEGGNKLYRNDDNRFTDVSEEAGIYGSAIGFGLGVTAADLNKDGWPDIFVSNDFFERDYLYINQKDGTFREALEEYVNEISMGSMGADIADLTNDGYPEIYVTEMLPATLDRVKTKTLFEDWDKYQSSVKSGYYHQFTRNVLQLNNGPVPGRQQDVSFSEISRLTGTEATDWSWGALIFDVNNDGEKDIFVANGIYKDLTDQDYINFYSNTELRLARLRQDSTMLTSMIDKIPSEPLDNHLFINRGNLEFTSAIEGSGLEGPGFSNGAVYADLDNDGDMELLINNINAPLGIYKNLSIENQTGNYLQLSLKGPGNNTSAFGTQVHAYAGGVNHFAEQQPVKGYMSTVDPRVHFGLGKNELVDSLIVIWPDRTVTRLKDVPVNQLLELDYSNAAREAITSSAPEKSAWMVASALPGLDTVRHRENDFVDFNRDRLLFEMYSNEGPPAATGDLNNDGLDDLVIGGAAEQPVRVFLQQVNGAFRKVVSADFLKDRRSEDTDILLADVNDDNLPDMIVASGGNEFSYSDARWIDRLYLNQGDGTFISSPSFSKSSGVRTSTAFYRKLDFDRDGDPDLLMGMRLEPFRYGYPVSALLLENNGKGEFTDVTDKLAPEMKEIGLLTDAVVIEGENDYPEWVLTGEWMRPVHFRWNGEAWEKSVLGAPSGLYKSACAADVNNDGLTDILLGNMGGNTRFNLSAEKPLTLFVGDYDDNRSVEHILSMYEGDSLYPLVLLQDLTRQMPVVRKKYQTFDSYKDAGVEEVLPDPEKGIRLEATSLASGVLLGNNDGTFTWEPFPVEAQVAPVYAMLVRDFNQDGYADILLGGNQRRAKPEYGIYNASFGVVLAGNGHGKFSAVPSSESGIWIRGEVRSLLNLESQGRSHVLVVRNNERLLSYTER